MACAKKPFKLMTSDRQIKKGVVCGSLRELAQKANTLYGIGENEVKFVLEEDGTEIIDDEYLMSLESQTIIMALHLNGHWTPPLHMVDETDRATTLKYDAVEILKRVKKNPCSIVLLSEEELDVVTSAELNNINIPGVGPSEVDYLKDACDRELERKQREKNALDLMDVLRKVNDSRAPQNGIE